MNADYVFSSAVEAAEFDRMRMIETAFDPASRRFLERLGIASGSVCLEIGAGAGSIMKWISERVKPGGRVVAVDLNTKFLQANASEGVEVRSADLKTMSLETGFYDVIHGRYVLMHLGSAAPEVLEKLVKALKPGGWLLLEDADFSVSMPADEQTAGSAGFRRVCEAIREMYVRMHIDFEMGKHLPYLMQVQKLVEVGTETQMPLEAGSSPIARLMKASVSYLKDRLVASGKATESDIAAYCRFADDPYCWAYYYATVSAWGRKKKDGCT